MSGDLRIGFAAALEQLHPTEAVDLAEYAEQRGFTGVAATDHFQPWLPAQGHSGFVWNVLSAIGQRTRGELGPGVTTPSFRWHPAVVAQASATLAAMYPGRHWLGIGSGEALNEHITGEYWPEAPERIERMFEAVELIKRLFASGSSGRDIRFTGRYFRLEATRLWTAPETPPPILIATTGPVTARRAGRAADGIISQDLAADRAAVLLERFSEGARESGRDPDGMPKALLLHLSWADDDDTAMRNALTHWPNGAMRFQKADIRSPFEFEQLARLVRPEHFGESMIVSSDPEVHRLQLQRMVDAGFNRIYLHNAGPNQREWIDVFSREVLPKVVR